MKALVANGPGGPEVLKLADIPKPSPGSGEILVRVCACALNPVDTKIRAGYLSDSRVYPTVYGYDVSGVVESAGEGVEGFAPGDEVFYYADLSRQGAYAEYHAVRASIVHKKPTGLTHVQAAALPLAGTTAWQGLFEMAKLAFGETVLIYGAAGGVGSMAVQMAAWAGANVIAVCSGANAERVARLGANHVIDYQKASVPEAVMEITGGAGADVALETIGGDVFFESFKSIKPFGRLVFLNAFAGDAPATLFNAARLKNLSIFFELARPDLRALDFVATLAERGFIKPQVESVISMENVAEGHRRLETRHGWGKIVVEISRRKYFRH
ncbi:MAG: NADP-dependent oxidoreductase [Nitrospinae bacterium]|nr:NADP-dependent oxidoreductase [Nitrospinota bacterium]